ncbi:hypothetical protein BpHYR1_052438 [Brachionus plicatilis]|uniref:C2H2-type domain-containing protein n=1 Tax=Brachionus plicatilis TaxID=10195 RepID=A0A3M7QY41_BRAPC|nr:hypothetical protein BpHYR1_052438 [Brachionus plicatilis]
MIYDMLSNNIIYSHLCPFTIVSPFVLIPKNLENRFPGSYLFHDLLVTKFVTCDQVSRYRFGDHSGHKITNNFKNVTLLDSKSKSNYYEKKSQEISEASEDVQIEIKKVLFGKKNPVECPDCGRFFESETGLKMHHNSVLIVTKYEQKFKKKKVFDSVIGESYFYILLAELVENK